MRYVLLIFFCVLSLPAHGKPLPKPVQNVDPNFFSPSPQGPKEEVIPEVRTGVAQESEDSGGVIYVGRTPQQISFEISEAGSGENSDGGVVTVRKLHGK